jgi:hypothetical protein
MSCTGAHGKYLDFMKDGYKFGFIQVISEKYIHQDFNLEYQKFSNAFFTIFPPSSVLMFTYYRCKSILDGANNQYRRMDSTKLINNTDCIGT